MHALIPNTLEDLCEVRASLVYLVGSRPVLFTWWVPGQPSYMVKYFLQKIKIKK